MHTRHCLPQQSMFAYVVICLHWAGRPRHVCRQWGTREVIGAEEVSGRWGTCHAHARTQSLSDGLSPRPETRLIPSPYGVQRRALLSPRRRATITATTAATTASVGKLNVRYGGRSDRVADACLFCATCRHTPRDGVNVACLPPPHGRARAKNARVRVNGGLFFDDDKPPREVPTNKRR